MPETILLVLIIAKIKRYDIKALFRMKEMYLVVAFELFYIIMQGTFFAGNYELLKYTGIFKSLYLCSYLGLVFKNELYREAIIGSGFIVLGGLCNDIAIRSNGGRMPAFPTLSYITGYIKSDSFQIAEQMANDFHVLGNTETNMKVFTDIFDLGYSILSIGDLFIRVFVFVILYQSIRKASGCYDKRKVLYKEV